MEPAVPRHRGGGRADAALLPRDGHRPGLPTGDDDDNYDDDDGDDLNDDNHNDCRQIFVLGRYLERSMRDQLGYITPIVKCVIELYD